MHSWTPPFPTRFRVFGKLQGCLITVLLVCIVGLGWAATPQVKPARISLLMATGMPGGTAYQAGLGMASLWTTKLKKMGIRVSAAISEGSSENIEAIRIADADLIIVDQLFLSMAYKGSGIYNNHPVTELRSIASLWPDIVHIIVRSEGSSAGTLDDLPGKILGTGLPDSGSKFLTELLVGTLGAKANQVSLRSMSPLAAAEALRSGTIQAMASSGGIPIPVIATLADEFEHRLKFLSVSDAELQSVKNDGWENAIRMVIPAGTYAGQTEPVPTVGQRGILAVAASLDPQVVYALTRVFFENLDYLAKVHPACKNIELAKAFEGLDVPLHRGAVRYFKERKVKIPERLLP
jgi:TRAP transporter TAXI family solute receptor